MIYLKIRADSKQDGIKREHVISPRPVFAVDKGVIRYIYIYIYIYYYAYVSASASQIWGWGGGREGDLKNCAYLWKNPGHAPCMTV